MSANEPSHSSSTPTNSNDASITDAAEYIPQADHLANSPVTKISPTNGHFPDAAGGAEAEFTNLCEKLNGPLQMLVKKEIKWSKRDPLHFWQSLAFALRSEELTCIAVASFVDTTGQNRLYIASNDPMTESQKQELTDIIHMFLDLKPLKEIAAKLLPRHLPYIVKQFDKINRAQLQAFTQEFPSPLSQAVEAMFYRKAFSLDDIRQLLNLIEDNREELRAMKDGKTMGTSEAAKNGLSSVQDGQSRG